MPLNVAVAERSPASSLSFGSEVELSPRLREITLRSPALSTKAGGLIPPNPTGESKIRLLVPEDMIRREGNANADYVLFIVFNNGSRFYRVEVRLEPR